MYRVIDCPACRGERHACDLCRGRRLLLCFPYVEVAADEELRLFRVRYLGSEAVPFLEFADEEK